MRRTSVITGCLGVMLSPLVLSTPSYAAPAGAADCTSGRLCLWDDVSFTDTKKTFSSSNPNLNNSGFSDKTSSAYNRDKVAWVLYDDTGYKDTAKCLKAGASVSNFGNFGFNDKTSSVYRRSNNTCPAGAAVFTGPN